MNSPYRRRPELGSNLCVLGVTRFNRVRSAGRRDNDVANAQELLASTRVGANCPAQDGDSLLLTRMNVQRNDGCARTHHEVKRKDVVGYLCLSDPKAHGRRLDLLPYQLIHSLSR